MTNFIMDTNFNWLNRSKINICEALHDRKDAKKEVTNHT